jgi:predicted phosphodiesterase
MRIALLADIHGNTVALDAVLADLERHRADRVVCLGDIAAGGPDPGGAIDRLIEIGAVAVQGNTDAGMVEMPGWWLDPASIGLPDAAVPIVEISVWTAHQLSTDHRRYLRDLPPTFTLNLGQPGEMLAFHGSPTSPDDIITATTPAEDIDRMLGGANAAVLAGGHTHVPLVRRHGTQTFVNPGSVGMPFADYGYAGGVGVLDHAAYAIVETIGQEITISLHQVAVDPSALASSVTQSVMPHGDWWLQLRRGHR